MKQLIIDGTKYSPRIDLDPIGVIRIQGRSIIEDPLTFYQPVLRWVKCCTFETLKMEIMLEYMNTSSTKQLFSLLNMILDNRSIKSIYINWYYEKGDEDILEMGREIESLIKIPFDYYECAEMIA
jgi:hypothetical protein